jgi:hypothetical protein
MFTKGVLKSASIVPFSTIFYVNFVKVTAYYFFLTHSKWLSASASNDLRRFILAG